ncbi:MAG: hypothetical protein AB1498_10565 [bacterium]
MAKEVVEKGIAYRYRYLDQNTKEEGKISCVSPEEYLDKMIQLPLELPPVEPEKRLAYIKSLLVNDGYKEYADIIEAGIGDNPRALKRYINLLVFISRRADDLKIKIKANKEEPDHKALIEKYFIPALYVKWSLIVFKFPDVHRDIKNYPKKLQELQDAANENSEKVKSGDENKKAIQIDDRLKKILKKEPFFPDDDWLIARFIHLTEATVIKAAETSTSRGYSQTFQPGDMVLIPKGK